MKALFRGLLLAMSMAVCAQEYDPVPVNLDPLDLEEMTNAEEVQIPESLKDDEYAEEVEPDEVLDVPRDQTRVAVRWEGICIRR